jgi:hypothetical protein
MIRRSAAALLAAGLMAVMIGACGVGGQAPSLPPEARVSILPDDPSQPYGIVAIDYHFHDAHPSRELAPTRPVLFSNQGTVKHNVTFSEFGFSRDVAPGEEFTIEDLGRKLGGPGVYTFFCKYHAALGMVGTLIVK